MYLLLYFGGLAPLIPEALKIMTPRRPSSDVSGVPIRLKKLKLLKIQIYQIFLH